MASLLENWSLYEGVKFMQAYVTVELVVKKKKKKISVILGHMVALPICIWRILLFH